MTILKKSREELTNKDLYFMLTDKSIKKLSELGGKKVKILDYVIYEDVRRDTGEIQKIVSIRTDDGSYASNSPSFIESFEKIIECFGNDFSEVAVIKAKSAKGREYLDCSYAG